MFKLLERDRSGDGGFAILCSTGLGTITESGTTATASIGRKAGVAANLTGKDAGATANR